jgi:glycerol-3-phosphate dehydrogenase (NAD(P)+)
MGCDPGTFAGLAGIGDLIVTATSEHSRNNRCGNLIGRGVPPAEAIKKVGMVVEGINAIPAALELQEKYGVEMPLVNAIDAVINHNADPKQTVHDLMTRAPRSELEYRRS